MNRETRELSVTQVVDINNCREKAARYTGMATTVLDNVSKQVRPPLSTAALASRVRIKHSDARADSLCVCAPIQKGDSVMSTVRYLYSVKPTADGGLITNAQGLERQFFTPFNVRGGNFKMQAV